MCYVEEKLGEGLPEAEKQEGWGPCPGPEGCGVWSTGTPGSRAGGELGVWNPELQEGEGGVESRGRRGRGGC